VEAKWGGKAEYLSHSRCSQTLIHPVGSEQENVEYYWSMTFL